MKHLSAVAALLAALSSIAGPAPAQNLGGLGQPGQTDNGSSPRRNTGPVVVAPPNINMPQPVRIQTTPQPTRPTRPTWVAPPIYGPTVYSYPPQGAVSTHPIDRWPTQTVITPPSRVYTNTEVIVDGGYYYGGYCDPTASSSYPSPYGVYGGVPTSVGGPSVVVIERPPTPTYVAPSAPYPNPSYSVTYNQTNYYDAARPAGTETTHAVPARPKSAPGSFQAAFADIETAWTRGDVQALHKHLPAASAKINIFLKRKYAYSLSPKDYLAMTRDAMTRLKTVSFDFTRLRKAKNGDITAYGVHVAQPRAAAASEDDATVDNTVPFDQSDRLTDNSDAPRTASEGDRTIYVSYTLRKIHGIWEIVNVGTSTSPLLK